MVILFAFMPTAKAQWVVTDPKGLTSNEIIQTSTTATNMINNFKEVKSL
jgi:hypothetical protein